MKECEERRNTFENEGMRRNEFQFQKPQYSKEVRKHRRGHKVYTVTVRDGSM